MYTPPVTPWELVIPEAGSLTCLQEGAIEGRISDWGEVVTRYPYGNVGMDHLLSKEKASVQRDVRKGFLISFERSKDFSVMIFENRTTKKTTEGL